ncbi:MAG: PEP-CTERM sorting domain-containing protein [Pirellulales bacterium]
MFHQWFWYRVGDAGPERTIDTLTHLESTPLDLNGDGLNEFLRTRYASPGLFTIQVNYLLNGASAGSNRSNLAEAIQIQNNSNLPLPLHFFQYADFDLNDSSNDDSLVITGTPRNTAHQTDPIMLVGETVTTQPPSHFEAGDVDALVSIEDRLNDALPTTLADVSGPLFSLDAAWAFQWDLLIPPGQSHLISKLKDIRPGPNIPEPGSLALVLGGLATMAIARRRWTRLG